MRWDDPQVLRGRKRWLAGGCHWYIEKIDYGRQNPWAPMYWLYLRANEYVGNGPEGG